MPKPRKNDTAANLGFETQLWDPEDPDEYRAAKGRPHQ